MIRGAFCSAWCQIDLSGLASLGQRGSGKNMIYAPAEVAIKSISEIIPVCVLHPFGMQLSENIDESPGNRLLVGSARI